jgi:hypothetical protein
MKFRNFKVFKAEFCFRILQTCGVPVVTLLVLGPAGSAVLAGVKHWEGDVNGYWNMAGNWLEYAVPVNGDQLEFSMAAYIRWRGVTNTPFHSPLMKLRPCPPSIWAAG